MAAFIVNVLPDMRSSYRIQSRTQLTIHSCCGSVLQITLVCSIYLDFRAAIQASCQQLPGLDGYRRQLPLVFQNVSNGVDVGYIGLLLIIHWNLSISADPQRSVIL